MNLLLEKLTRYSFGKSVFVCTLFLSVGIAYTLHLHFGFDLEYFPGSKVDSKVMLYTLEHAFKYITFDTPLFWDAPFFYSIDNSLALGENFFGLIPLYSIVRFFFSDPLEAFQYFIIGLTSLYYFITRYVLKKLAINSTISSFLACLIIISLNYFSSIVGFQALCSLFFPLILYHFFNYMQFKRSKSLKIFFLFLSIQFYCCIQIGVITILAISIYLLYKHIKKLDKPEVDNKSRLSTILLSSLILIIPVGVILIPYLNISSEFDLNYYQLIINESSQSFLTLKYYLYHTLKLFGVYCLIIIASLVFQLFLRTRNKDNSYRLGLSLVVLFGSLITLFSIPVIFQNISLINISFYLLNALSIILILSLVLILVIPYINNRKHERTLKTYTILLIAMFWIIPVSKKHESIQAFQGRMDHLSLIILNMKNSDINGIFIPYNSNSPYASTAINHQFDVMFTCQKLNYKCANGMNIFISTPMKALVLNNNFELFNKTFNSTVEVQKLDFH